MMRDAEIGTQDTVMLEDMGLDVFDYDSVKRYRTRMKKYRPGHVWEKLDDVEFLYRIGAVGRTDDGKLHPTAAGLLMFGYEYEIVKEFPTYFLDYQEQLDSNARWTDRIVSSSGDWSGNVYDFYFRIYDRITRAIEVSDKIEGGDASVHNALREALANCLINADYHGRQGIVIIKKKDIITFSNPGGFRIDIEAAKSGGISDPRNGALIKMFNLIGVGKRAGSGIPNIFGVWKKQGLAAPVITESFDPDRITLSLTLNKTSDKKQSAEADEEQLLKTVTYGAAIVTYLTENVSASCEELSALIGTSEARTIAILRKMIEENILVAEGKDNGIVYKLKA